MSNKPCIIIDTREQRGYSFSPRVDTIERALPAGDYSLLGYETLIAIERKSFADYISTVIHAQERFARELSILRSYPRAWIVVEARMGDILAGNYESRVSPQALFAMTASLQSQYNIQIEFADNREIACAWVEELLWQYWQGKEGKER